MPEVQQQPAARLNVVVKPLPKPSVRGELAMSDSTGGRGVGNDTSGS
jgi:hypothetical protein